MIASLLLCNSRKDDGKLKKLQPAESTFPFHYKVGQRVN